MLTLAVATRAETFDRMAEPLAERAIRVTHVPASDRSIPLTEPIEGLDVGFVFPPRLMEGGALSALLDVPWVNDREAVLRSRNKAGVLARLAREGLPVPDTVMISDPVDEAELKSAFERVGSPAVVKPNSATRGIGVTRVSDLDSLFGVTDYLEAIHEFPATGDRSFLVQEYLPEALDYRAMVVDGEYVGAVERRLPNTGGAADQWKHNVHRGAEAIGVDLPQDFRDLAERAARTLDIPWLGVDLLVAGDRTAVLETNARPTIDDATKYEDGFYDRLAELIKSRTR